MHAGANSAPVLVGIQVSHIDTTDGNRLGVAIPLASLGINSAANTQFGLDVQLNEDDDGGARDQKLAWNATVDDAWQNPSLFGTAKLVTTSATPTPIPTPSASNSTWQPAGFGGAGAFLSLHFDRTNLNKPLADRYFRIFIVFSPFLHLYLQEQLLASTCSLFHCFQHTLYENLCQFLLPPASGNC